MRTRMHTMHIEYTLRCISVQLQVDNHVLEQSVAGIAVHMLLSGDLRWGWLGRVQRSGV